jgi:hypothetical protein
MEKRKWESYNYTLSQRWLYIIVGYYLTILLCGIVVSIVIIANISGFVSDNVLLYTTFASIAVAVMLCSVQYLKRIYKACLNNRMLPLKPDETIKQFGNIMYFILRPIYAIIFVLIFEFVLLSGVIIVVPVDFKINERFFYLCIVIASFIGFSIGRILDRFEAFTSKQVDNLLKIRDET